MKDNLQNISDLIGALAEDIEEIKKILATKDASDKDEALKRLAVKLEPIVRFAGGKAIDNINDIFAGGDGISYFSRIAVYDWKGRALELIHTDSDRINAIHADEKAGVLYAIFWKDGKQYFGELKLD